MQLRIIIILIAVPTPEYWRTQALLLTSLLRDEMDPARRQELSRAIREAWRNYWVAGRPLNPEH